MGIKMLVSEWWVAVPCACVTFLIQLNKCFIKCLLFNQDGVNDVSKDVSEMRHVFYLWAAYESGHAMHSSSETLLGFLLP